MVPRSLGLTPTTISAGLRLPTPCHSTRSQRHVGTRIVLKACGFGIFSVGTRSTWRTLSVWHTTSGTQGKRLPCGDRCDVRRHLLFFVAEAEFMFSLALHFFAAKMAPLDDGS